MTGGSGVRAFDLIVISSGSGLEVSAEAVERGLAVAVIEQGPFGGTCLNRGCIPSKLLIHCADVMETIRHAKTFGIAASVQAVDWQFIVRRAYGESDAEAQAIEEETRQAPNITVYKESARFAVEEPAIRPLMAPCAAREPWQALTAMRTAIL